ANGLAVEDRFPVRAGIGALPHASIHRTHVKQIWLTGYADCGQCASPAKRADQTPAEAGVKRKINRLGQGGLQRETKQKSEGAKKGSSPVSHVRSCRVLNFENTQTRSTNCKYCAPRVAAEHPKQWHPAATGSRWCKMMERKLTAAEI